MKATFGICADLHTEFIHDAPKRMEQFLKDCAKNNVDFCVNLGDFCPPGETNYKHKNEILAMLNSSSIPFHHVLGNHDMDENSKSEVLEFMGVSAPHASFDVGGIHFVILDACHFKTDDGYASYDHGNYKTAFSENVPVLPPSELEWLKADLEAAKYPSVIFSHQSLIESRTGIRNPEDFRRVIRSAPNKVIMAMCGHEHVDRVELFEGVWYVCVNSMSYYWAGERYDHETFGKDIESIYPLLRFVFPYKEAVYAIVTVSDKGIAIKGKASEIVGALPESMNFKKIGFKEKITASISTRELNWKG